jgi:hypothetical protein
MVRPGEEPLWMVRPFFGFPKAQAAVRAAQKWSELARAVLQDTNILVIELSCYFIVL